MRRPLRIGISAILALGVALSGSGWCGAVLAGATTPADANLAVIPDLGRYFGTWLWLATEGIVAVSSPETKGAYRRLVLNPDLTYGFHQRRGARDTVLCQGRYVLSEQTSPDGAVTEIIEFDAWYEPYEKSMLADFDTPDTLRLIGFPCEKCPDHTFARGDATTIHAEVTRGQAFRIDLWGGLRFELEPIALGWKIAVRDTMRPDEDLARLTPPFHFVPNPRFIEGWHFRNKANTAPNGGDVNAPQKEREFIFSREVGRSIQGPDASNIVTEEEVERVGEAGRGVLTIEEMKLDEPGIGEKARIESMKFTVAIEEVTRRAP